MAWTTEQIRMEAVNSRYRSHICSILDVALAASSMLQKSWIVALLLLTATSSTALAQEDPEYRLELGGGVGLISYQGDFSSSLSKNAQLLFAAVAKYRFNPRMDIALRISNGKLKGNADNLKTWYPETIDREYSFSHSTTDVCLTYEYNFWPYGTGREYKGAVPLTPYIALGLGMTFTSTKNGGVNSTNFPLGLGVKYKVAERVNLSAEWMMHFTMSDKIDGVEDPYGIAHSGMFKNCDSYSTLQVAVTYDLWAKCKTCNTDRW